MVPFFYLIAERSKDFGSMQMLEPASRYLARIHPIASYIHISNENFNLNGFLYQCAVFSV